ncbi:calcium-binding protein [Catenovulum sediminis]|uniref:Calcium-binding protein n=1 Tax=Catenovulum sediminis TaxID=1740262 RepID=A0ABV1RF37_9ALTE
MFLNIKASIFILLMFFAPLTQAREVWLAEQWQNKANSTNIQTAKLSLSSCEDTVDYLWYQVTVSKSLSHSDIPPDIFVAIASHEWFVDHPNAKLYYEGKKNGIPVIQLDIGGHTNGLTSVQHPQCDIGDSCNTARQVPLDYVFTNEDIRYAGDKDVFKFTVEELKTIELYSTGEANVIGTLLNSSCQSIQVSQGFDQTNNFNIERILQPGNYYIQLQDQDNKHFGDYYDLHFVSGANAKVFNDTSGNQTIVGTDFGDVINQTSGNDQIYGGLGNDTISLINGSSVVHFDLGDGQDTLSVRRNNSSSYKPKLLFGNNITPDMVSLSKNGEDLYLTINNTTDQVIITDYFLYEAWYHRLEWIEFAIDSTQWTYETIKSML